MAASPNRSGTAVALVIFAAMIAGLFYRYWPNEERDIRRHMSNLAEGLSIPTTDNEVERITRFAALREYFAPDVRLLIDAREVVTRDAVIALVRAVQPPPGGITVEAANLTVALEPGQERARVQMTARAISKDPVTGQTTVDERPGDLTMVKRDGDWVIASASFVAVR